MAAGPSHTCRRGHRPSEGLAWQKVTPERPCVAGTRRLGQGWTGTVTNRRGGRDVRAVAGAPAARRLLELEGAQDGRCLKILRREAGGFPLQFGLWLKTHPDQMGPREPGLGGQQPVRQQGQCAWREHGPQTVKTGHSGQDGVPLSNLGTIHFRPMHFTMCKLPLRKKLP